MAIGYRPAAFFYRCVIIAVSGWGIYLNLGLPERLSLSALVFYTVLSNVVCFLFFLLCAVYTALDWRACGRRGITAVFPHFKGAVTMMITVTFLIYHFLLAPRSFSMDSGAYFWSLKNLLVHYAVPLLVIFDWLLFDEKGRYRILDPLRWLAIPFAYLAFALIRAEVGAPIAVVNSRYPYFFIDVDALGAGGVLRYVLAITAFFTALGYLILLIDRMTARVSAKPKGQGTVL